MTNKAGADEVLEEFRTRFWYLDRPEDETCKRERLAKERVCWQLHICPSCQIKTYGSRARVMKTRYPYCAECITRATPATDIWAAYAKREETGPFDEMPRPVTSFTFELNVPSGAIVVGNDFRDHFDTLGDFDINEDEGVIEQTKAMEAIGCAHAYVGNSCPSVNKISSRELVIGTCGEKEKLPGKRVASIITDLWWYSIVDRDEYVRRGCEGKYNATTIKVEPGVYRFRHYFKRTDNYDKAFIYTKVKWVRKPDPVRDFAAESKKLNFTAGQIIGHKIKRWPTLYGKGGLDSVMTAANHIFCVIGGGGDWHKNGFVVYDPEITGKEPEIEIPEFFNKPYDWYPMCEYSNIVRAAGLGDYEIHLNPSFQDLAFNVLETIIEFGSKSHPENVKLAEKCYKQLAKKYPEALLKRARSMDTSLSSKA